MEVILWPPSLNSSVFHLLEDKVRFSVPLRIRILENNDRKLFRTLWIHRRVDIQECLQISEIFIDVLQNNVRLAEIYKCTSQRNIEIPADTSNI